MPLKSLMILMLFAVSMVPYSAAAELTANIPADRKMPISDPSGEETTKWRMEALNDRFGAKIDF